MLYFIGTQRSVSCLYQVAESRKFEYPGFNPRSQMTEQKPANKSRTVSHVAATSQGLGGAVRQAQAFQALNERVVQSLPDSVRPHVRIACIEGDCLMIGAESPAWATQARLWADTMVNEAAALWPVPIRRSEIFVSNDSFRLIRGDL